MLIDLLVAFFPFLGGKRRRVIKRGERMRATIDAIEVGSAEGGPSHTWGLTLENGTRAGVRQDLCPEGERAQLGTEVVVRHHEGLVVIDWPATLGRRGSIEGDARPLKRPPAVTSARADPAPRA